MDIKITVTLTKAQRKWLTLIASEKQPKNGIDNIPCHHLYLKGIAKRGYDLEYKLTEIGWLVLREINETHRIVSKKKKVNNAE
ncbi:hypothetical protein [uncultured Desulfovibrio sp.]|uniref:hypothetical protein n=1 Tax=uncultured Desulfovibrio sp. TaxID=167968 RepID=UPI00260CD815|nr:hypothetical protein [uncultured Desulfovibrio sp.]